MLCIYLTRRSGCICLEVALNEIIIFRVNGHIIERFIRRLYDK